MGPVMRAASLTAVSDTSSKAPNDASPSGPNDDASLSAAADTRRCGWCHQPLDDVRSIYCRKCCRQSAWRLRRSHQVDDAPAGLPGQRFAFADPPYPGLSRRYYRHEASYEGEVDHRELVDRLQAGGYLGWALSTSSRALRDVLPLCPASARVCAWVKPIGASPRTHGLHNCWEPLIVVGGRRRRPGVRDWLAAQPARHEGELPGRKPQAFCQFLFSCLGMVPGDLLDDLYPGTGIIGRAWSLLSSGPSGDVSADGVDDGS
jgi:hypothetical protein